MYSILRRNRIDCALSYHEYFIYWNLRYTATEWYTTTDNDTIFWTEPHRSISWASDRIAESVNCDKWYDLHLLMVSELREKFDSDWQTKYAVATRYNLK